MEPVQHRSNASKESEVPLRTPAKALAKTCDEIRELSQYFQAVLFLKVTARRLKCNMGYKTSDGDGARVL
jgi:hypothetical protein